MGDSLSIPAGVVGMVALGIQLCQTLCTYCNNVKERTRDVEIVSRQIESLESTFRSLDSIIRRIESPLLVRRATITSLNQCINDCGSGVEELGQFVASIDGIRKDSFKNKIQGAGRKLAYGFRRGGLSNFAAEVTGAHNNS